MKTIQILAGIAGLIFITIFVASFVTFGIGLNLMLNTFVAQGYIRLASGVIGMVFAGIGFNYVIKYLQ